MLNKKIIMVGSLPPPIHGSNIYFQNLINSKIKKEFEIHYVDTSDHRNLDNLGKLDIINIYLAIKNIIDLSIKLIQIRPILVYIPISANLFSFFRDGLFILFSKWFSKAQIVIHLHGGDYFRKEFYNKSNIVVKYFISSSLKRANCAIVLSNNLTSIFTGLVKKTMVAFNGIDNHIIPNFKKDPNHLIKIGYLGNLIISKGILDLIEAFNIVLKHDSNIILEFAGSYTSQDDAKELVQAIIKKYRLETKVFNRGVIKGNEKEKFLIELDIFVFPTFYPFEGLPLVILEAMAAGLPIITTSVGSIPELVIDGETGFIIGKNNPQAAADAIIKLIENLELRMNIGKAGRKRYEEYFTLDHNINRMIEVFNEVLGGK